MPAPVLPFLLPGFAVDTIRTIDMKLLVEAHSTTPQMACPSCQQPSFHVHSHYCRIPRDLPATEQAVRLLLHVRRFFCDNPACTRRTFAERLPAVVPFRAQRTCRLTRSLHVVVTRQPTLARNQGEGLWWGAQTGCSLGTPSPQRASADRAKEVSQQAES
jgi:transposase